MTPVLHTPTHLSFLSSFTILIKLNIYTSFKGLWEAGLDWDSWASMETNEANEAAFKSAQSSSLQNGFKLPRENH
jgi:hypothetical protein